MSDSDYQLEVESPISAIPDLDALGIDEIEPGVCEDSIENRKIIRRELLNWYPLFDSNGEPTNLIQVVSDEMHRKYRASRIEAKSDLLVNPRDLNSDYKTGLDLLLDDEAQAYAPAWVVAAARFWNEVEIAREEGRKKGVNPHLEGPPQRCTYIRRDGSRCLYWHNGMATSAQACRIHQTRPEHQRNLLAKARTRVISASVAAVDELENLMLSATSEPVKLKAATEMLDRAGIRGGIEIESTVDVNIRPAADIIAERLAKLAGAQKAPELEEIVVDDDGNSGTQN